MVPLFLLTWLLSARSRGCYPRALQYVCVVGVGELRLRSGPRDASLLTSPALSLSS